MVDDFFIWQRGMTTDVPSLLSFQLGLFLTQHLGLNSKDKNNAKSSDDNSCIQLMLGIYYATVWYPEPSGSCGTRTLMHTWRVKPGIKSLWIPALWKQWESKRRDREQEQPREISCCIPVAIFCDKLWTVLRCLISRSHSVSLKDLIFTSLHYH